MSYRSGAPADVLRVHEMLTPKPKVLRATAACVYLPLTLSISLVYSIDEP